MNVARRSLAQLPTPQVVPMKQGLDNKYFPIINAVPNHAGGPAGLAATGTFGHDSCRPEIGLSSHVFDQLWICGYSHHAPRLGISKLLPHTEYTRRSC
jgi:hypothetical protein